MADNWTTPIQKSSLPPHLRPSSRVTPTLQLSEGPLSPSSHGVFNNLDFLDSHGKFVSPIDKATAPIYRMKIDPENEENESIEEKNVEIIKLQCQVEQLTQLVQDRLGSDTITRSNLATSEKCICHGIPNCRLVQVEHSQCQETLENILKEKESLHEVLRDSKCRVEKAEKETSRLREKLEGQTAMWKIEMESLRQDIHLEQTKVREKDRDYEKMLRAKTRIEAYMQELPSVDEFVRIKNELKEKTESCKRLTTQIANLNITLNKHLECSETRNRQGAEENKKLEELKLEIEQLQAENIAHEKRASKSSTSGTVNIEGVLFEKDKLAKENENLKKYVIAITKKHSRDMENKSTTLQNMSEKIVEGEGKVAELTNSLTSEQSRNKHLRDQITTNIARQIDLKKKIELLNEELVSSVNKNDTSKDLEILHVKANVELVKCVNEMKQLMHVSKQLAKREEPDVSMLIGFSSSAIASEGASTFKTTLPPLHNNFNSDKSSNGTPSYTEGNGCSFQNRLNFWRRSVRRSNCDEGLSKGQLVQKKPASVDDRIKEVRSILLSVEDIRNEVGELREYLSEKYAESVAESVSNCTTQ